MLTLFVSLIANAGLKIAGKLLSDKLFEKVASDALIYVLEKLAPMTSNTLDDEIVAEIKKRLTV